MSKFKVGDKVRVKSDLKAGQSYGNDFFVEDMEQYKDKIITLRRTLSQGQYLAKETEFWSWTDEMLEAVETVETTGDLEKTKQFKVGDRVVVNEKLPTSFINLKGTVIKINNKKQVTVRLDPPFEAGHKGLFEDINSDKPDCWYFDKENLDLLAENAEIDNAPKIKLEKKEEIKEMVILKRFVGFFTDEEMLRAMRLADEIVERGYHKAKLLVVKDGFSFNYGFKKNTVKRVTIRRAQKMVTL